MSEENQPTEGENLEPNQGEGSPGEDNQETGAESNPPDSENTAPEAEAQGAPESGQEGEGEEGGSVEGDVTPADLETLNGSGVPEENGASPSLDVVLDIPVTLAMEIGKTKINIRDLLQLHQGSVVELDRLAGEPLDVLVNNVLVAHGEVVVVNDKFGIRLTDVISAQERIEKLK